NTAVTSRLKPLLNAMVSEALLFVDEPNSGLPGASKLFLACGSASGCSITGNGSGAGTYSGAAGHPNIFQGVVSGNSVTFFGWPPDPPGPAPAYRVLRFTGIRANANALGSAAPNGSTPVVATLSPSPPAVLPISNPSVIVGFVQSAL